MKDDRPRLYVAHAWIVVSGNIRIMRISAGVFWRVDVNNDSGVVRNGDFHCFGCYIIGTFGEKAKIIIQ